MCLGRDGSRLSRHSRVIARHYPAGVDDLPRFPYFADPAAEGILKRRADPCPCCGLARGWIYTGPIYGAAGHPKFVCPWCIADGSAAAKFGCVFNDAGYLGRPRPPVGPDIRLPPDEQQAIERRTPGFTTWQGNHWMDCCGHACIYLGEASAEDLAGRWAAAVPSILEELTEWIEDRRAKLIRGIRKGGGPCAYVFQCQRCRGLRGYWDMS
jgi:uncharacterized protein CbrC (UPF0167 family)